jgi:alkylation response protein AidB-like acyl-CoA dehydrogenase
MGASMLTTALAVQALGRSCTDEGLVFSVCAHLCTCVIPLMLHGTPDQKRIYLEACAQGRKIGGNGSSEAAAGSDIAAMKTRVESDGDRFVLNGAKLYVSNGTVADIFIVYAKHPQGMSMADISAFVVERKFPGFAMGQVFKKMGLRTCPLCEIVFNDCKVPAENLLGRERFGMRVFNDSMLWERIVMAAYHIGSMEQQFGFVLKHATTRKQFGRRIIEHQEVSGKIVDMKLGIETSKLLLYKTASDYDRGSRDLPQASLLKYHSSESKVKNSLSAVQILGAGGYIRENPVEKQLRDSIAATIYSGTSEIQKKIIAEGLQSHG